jgi:hypothetical protein
LGTVKAAIEQGLIAILRISTTSVRGSKSSLCSSVRDVMKSPASVSATTTAASQGAATMAVTGTTRSVQSSTGSSAASATASKSGAGMLKPTMVVLKVNYLKIF